MQKAELSKIEYEIKYTSSGKCPHCNASIETAETEVLEDAIGYMETAGELYHNCLLNISDIRKTWADRTRHKIPIVSRTECTTWYVLKGTCPYCRTGIEIREDLEIIYNAPPAPEPSRIREVHGLEKCPKCNETIHISGGNFYGGVECPDHSTTSKNGVELPQRWDECRPSHRGRPRGTGTRPITCVRCPVCSGKTTVSESLYLGQDSTGTGEVQCKSCGGRGYVVV